VYIKITNRRITPNESDPHLIYKECFPRPELRYDENQPRDDYGRFTSGDPGLTSGGDSGIVKLGINMFDTSDPIYVDAFSIEEEPGFEDVFLHGSSTHVQITRNGKPVNLTPKEFADELKSRGYNGGNIRLASCSTGKGENSFAQQLSNELGVKVKAPDDEVYLIADEGIMFVGSQFSNTGKWRAFDKGVEIFD